MRLFIFLMMLGTTTTFANEITFGRCQKDKLVDQKHVLGRIDWAIKCTKQTGFTPEDKVRMLFEVGPDMKVRKRKEALYPVFAKAASNDVWRAPITKDKPCTIPPGYAMRGFCHRGCFAPMELLLFPGGHQYVSIAAEQNEEVILGVHRDASLDNLSFEKVAVKSFVYDLFDSRQEVRVITVESGEEIRVTFDHPMVIADGSMKSAGELKEGDQLLRHDGVSLEVVELTKETFKGRVYNVLPRTWNKKNNILVVNGFLTGSMRYQNKAIEWLNRKLLRRSLPEDLFF